MENKRVNILIMLTKAFPHRENSFSQFYTQLTDWFTQKGYNSKLVYAYIGVNDYEYDNGCMLPDNNPEFYTPRNIAAITEYIECHKINVILDYSHTITKGIKKFYKEIRHNFPHIKIFTMIHSCPNHTVQLMKHTIANRKWNECSTIKKKIQFLLPRTYLYLLQKHINRDNRSAYETMDEVVVLSDSYINEFRKMIGKMNAQRISAIPNAPYPVCCNIPFEEKQKEILWVGRVENEKNVKDMLKIWSNIADKIPDWKMKIVGQGNLLPHLKELSSSMKLPRIEFTGYQKSLPIIEKGSIICLTSVIEGLPTIFIEAMMLKTVPIGYNSYRAIYDLINDGENGYIIPYRDIDSFEKHLLNLCNDDKLRKHMAEKGFEKSKQFTIEQVGPKWEALFRKHQII